MDGVSETSPESLEYALSIKQPWATLLVHGIKTIEVRRWLTPRRGRVLIHAARIPDPREAGWLLVPAKLRSEAQVVGGIIGAADLTDCLIYRNLADFAADQERHRNDPAWFEPPVLYGFRFGNMTPIPFRRFPGWVRFFPVADKYSRQNRKKHRRRSPK
jgi:hypothetical protein